MKILQISTSHFAILSAVRFSGNFYVYVAIIALKKKNQTLDYTFNLADFTFFQRFCNT